MFFAKPQVRNQKMGKENSRVNNGAGSPEKTLAYKRKLSELRKSIKKKLEAGKCIKKTHRNAPKIKEREHQNCPSTLVGKIAYQKSTGGRVAKKPLR